MKKSGLVIALAFGITSAFAQDLTSKKGEPILPEAGDWSIGIDATPFLTYAGGFLSGAGATAPTMGFFGTSNAILGKKFIDEKTAYRGGLRLGFGSSKSAVKVATNPATTPTTYVDDVTKTSGTNIALTAGKEYRKGKTRLQGYYGAEAGIFLSTGKTTYTYGNAASTWTIGKPHATEAKIGATFGLGARAFIGAEYFIFPKMAIGGEFGWGLLLTTTGEGQTVSESWDGTKTTQTTVKTGKSSSFIIDTDNQNSMFGPAAAIHLSLHF